MQYIIYFLIALFATSLGSVIGLGGGIIIKPVLDTLGDYELTQIVFLSSCTVFFMAIVSTYKNIKKDLKIINRSSIFLIIGSTVGGFVGSKIFNIFLNYFDNPNVVQKIQSLILICIIIYVLIIKFINKQLHLRHNAINFCISGLIMGIISSFLSIGGGPVNMSILVLGFGFSVKIGAIYSTLTILFAQGISIFNYFNFGSTLFEGYEIVYIMILGGILGAMIGSVMSNKFSDKIVEKIFVVTLLFLIILNLNTILK